MRKLLLLIVATALLVPSLTFALDVPKLQGRVNDYANIISGGEKAKINEILKNLEDTDSTQVVVLTIPSLEGESIEGFAIRVADQWKIGQKGKDNGAILLVSKADKKLRIEVGYGLEGTLTDATSSVIINQIIVPSFKKGKFGLGILQGVDAMAKAVRGEFKAPPKRKKAQDSVHFGQFLFLLLMFGSFFFNAIASRRRKHSSAYQGSSSGLGAALPFIILGSGMGRHNSGGFGGGGFDSFGGGGGGFGGGGASGDW